LIKGIENNDEFTYNADFTSKLKRVKVPLVAMKEVLPQEEAGNEGIPASVEEDRRHLVEAALVRIMKARKTLSHNELIAEVTKQISMRFNPTPQVSISHCFSFLFYLLLFSLSKNALRA
jgi:cullin 3